MKMNANHSTAFDTHRDSAASAILAALVRQSLLRAQASGKQRAYAEQPPVR